MRTLIEIQTELHTYQVVRKWILDLKKEAESFIDTRGVSTLPSQSFQAGRISACTSMLMNLDTKIKELKATLKEQYPESRALPMNATIM